MPVTPKAAVLALEGRASTGRAMSAHDAELLRRWLELWKSLEPELVEAVSEVLETSKTGRVRPSRLVKAKRIAQALAHAREQITEIVGDYNAATLTELPEQVTTMLQVHEQVTASQLPKDGVGYTFDQVDDGALNQIIARSSEQITAAHMSLPAAIEETLRGALARGVAVGENPVETARRVIKVAGERFTGGMARATMIARTEMLDAQRRVAQAWEENNQGVLEGWVWVCAFDKRSCPSCIAMHGSVHSIDEQGPNDHHNGRCARAPKTRSWSELGIKGVKDTSPVIPTGEEIFHQLDETEQNQLIGASRAALIRDGKISFSDLSEKRATPGWRDSYHMRTLQDLERIANETH